MLVVNAVFFVLLTYLVLEKLSTMIEVFILAVALSMDAFAVSIGLGTQYSHRKLTLGLRAGLYFGVFQGVMPLVGYAAGLEVFTWIDLYAPWIAFILQACAH